MRVAILGAGYAGEAAAKQLLKSGHIVELIDPIGRHESSILRVLSRNCKISAVQRKVEGVTLHKASAVKIDAKKQEVSISSKKKIKYDYLLIAIGNRPAVSRVKGLKTHAYMVESASSANALSMHILHLFKKLKSFDELRKKAALTFVIAGATRSACEIAVTVHDLVMSLCKKKGLDEHSPFVYILDEQKVLAPELPLPEREFLRSELERREISVQLNTKIEKVTSDVVLLDNHAEILCKTFIWANLDIPKLLSKFEHGGDAIVCERSLQVLGQKQIFAAGDCARFMKDAPQVLEPHIAQKQGLFAAKNIDAISKGLLPREWEAPACVARVYQLGDRPIISCSWLHIRGFFARLYAKFLLNR